MTQLYMPFKNRVERIIKKHFPTFLAKRFSYRMDSEIWIPKADESIWSKKKLGKESCHILFDMEHIFEVEVTMSPQIAEVEVLRAFRDAIKDGRVTIEKVPEYLTKQQVRSRKRKLQKKKKTAIMESFKEAKADPFNTKRSTKRIGGKKRVVYN